MGFTKLITEAGLTKKQLKLLTMMTMMTSGSTNEIKQSGIKVGYQDSIQANTTKYKYAPYFNRFQAWPFSDEKVCVVNPVVCAKTKS